MFHLNWVDYIIIIVVCYYVYDGWENGIIRIFTNFLSFLVSLYVAVRFHTILGNFITDKVGVPAMWSDVLGYVLLMLVTQGVVSEVFGILAEKVPAKMVSSQYNKILGAFFSMLNAYILAAFFLLVVLNLPIRGNMKKDIKNSTIGSQLVSLAEAYGGSITSSLDDATKEMTKFFTIEPKSTESVNLDVAPKSSELTVDEASETTMVGLVNTERTKRGLAPLRVDPAIAVVAREHSRDMFLRRYFSHIDPDGHDGKDRFVQAGIQFQVVGENLAYAPDVNTAHTGLMNSEGHRENIVSTEYHRIGIGIISSVNNGQMFTQMFAD